MGNEKFNELLETLKEKDESQYVKAQEMIDFLKNERVHFVGNDLRNMLGRTPKDIDFEKIINCAKKLNELATTYGIEFQIPETKEGVKQYMRYTILEDVQTEFKNQAN